MRLTLLRVRVPVAKLMLRQGACSQPFMESEVQQTDDVHRRYVSTPNAVGDSGQRCRCFWQHRPVPSTAAGSDPAAARAHASRPEYCDYFSIAAGHFVRREMSGLESMNDLLVRSCGIQHRHAHSADPPSLHATGVRTGPLIKHSARTNHVAVIPLLRRRLCKRKGEAMPMTTWRPMCSPCQAPHRI